MEEQAVAPPEQPTQPVARVNPLLARVEMPGSTFQLPSRGLFYKKGELRDDVELGEIHVHPMSAYDEILMKSPDHLFSGEAVDKVFKRCMPQILQPLKLLAKDVDFLLVCLRQVTFGNEMDVTYTHDCKDAKSHPYIIHLSEFLSSSKKIDPTSVVKNYTTTLENGQVVKLNPSRFEDVIKLYQTAEGGNQLTPEDELDVTVHMIRSVIFSVDGEEDPEFIGEWIRTISAGWLVKVTSIIEKASDFGPDFTLHTTCKDCKKKIEIQTPVNPISFFM